MLVQWRLFGDLYDKPFLAEQSKRKKGAAVAEEEKSAKNFANRILSIANSRGVTVSIWSLIQDIRKSLPVSFFRDGIIPHCLLTKAKETLSCLCLFAYTSFSPFSLFNTDRQDIWGET